MKNKNIFVADIMTREPRTIKPDTNLMECIKKMVKKRTGSFPVLEKNKLVGFISRHDVLWAIIKKSKRELKDIKVIEIARKKIATIRPMATVDEAFNKMKKSKLQKLPVIQEGEFVGMITLKDILNFSPEFYPELDELAQIREESQKLKRLKKRETISNGICEECGNQEMLYKFNGMMVCEPCMNS